MSDDFIKKALENAAIDYIALMGRRMQAERVLAEVDREAAKLSFKIVSLAALCDDIPKDTVITETLKAVSKLGLTDAVRSVLRASGDWMTAKDVRDQVVKLGVDLSKYQNPLASINTILNRLDKEVDMGLRETPAERQANIRAKPNKGGEIKTKGKFIYRWKGPVETVWERLQKLPPDKADEVVKQTAKSLAYDELHRRIRKRSTARKKE